MYMWEVVIECHVWGELGGRVRQALDRFEVHVLLFHAQASPFATYGRAFAGCLGLLLRNVATQLRPVCLNCVERVEADQNA